MIYQRQDTLMRAFGLLVLQWFLHQLLFTNGNYGGLVRWKSLSSFINVNFTTNVSWQHTAEYVGLCGMFCYEDKNCLSFGYNFENNVCQGHGHVNLLKASHDFQITTGAKYFVSDTPVKCPNGWVVYGRNCYLFGDKLADWSSASKICEGMDAHLVTVENDHENHFLQTTLQNLHGIKNEYISYWMDGNDLATEGEWVWSRKNKSITYSNWYPGEPNGRDEQNCLCLNGDLEFRWDDYYCNSNITSICETE